MLYACQGCKHKAPFKVDFGTTVAENCPDGEKKRRGRDRVCPKASLNRGRGLPLAPPLSSPAPGIPSHPPHGLRTTGLGARILWMQHLPQHGMAMVSRGDGFGWWDLPSKEFQRGESVIPLASLVRCTCRTCAPMHLCIHKIPTNVTTAPHHSLQVGQHPHPCSFEWPGIVRHWLVD